MTSAAVGEESSRSDAVHLLGIYLEDHLAAAVAGNRRMRRLADAESDGADGPTLAKLADENERDLTALREVIDHFGVSPHAYKRMLTQAAEVAGLLKLNGRWFSRSPLTTLVEVELMLVAARGKLAGWESLRVAFGQPVLGPVNLDDLITRGRSHLDTFAAIHERAAITALGAACTP